MFSEHRLQILNVDELVNQAIEAHKSGEIMEITGVCLALFWYIRYYGIALNVCLPLSICTSVDCLFL